MRRSMLSRRTWLRHSALAAAAVPYVITSTALGNDTTPPASERVTLGHIGVGGRGRSVMRGFMTCKGAQCVAVADPYEDRREACATMIKGKAYRDFRDLLARNDIDGVVVATPDHWHVPAAIAAAAAKKDAYVEKPLGLTIEQDLACRRVFQQHKRMFQYGTQQRSMAHCRLGCELVRAGRIGKVHTIEVIAPGGGTGGSTEAAPVPAGLDFDLWVGPAPTAAYTVDRCKTPGTYWIYDYSIGYLAGWGAHPLDILVWICDSDQAGPFTIEGTGELPASGLYDTVYKWDCTLTMADGVKITFKPGGDSTKFIGDKGWIDVRRKGNDASDKALLESKLTPEECKLVVSPRHDQNFVDSIRSRVAPVSTIEHAVRSDIISQLCDIAIRLKRKITWDPKTEKILGDAEASKMMTRPMRAPWTLG